MQKSFISCLLFVLLLQGQVSSMQTGLDCSADIDVIQHSKDYILPSIFELMGKITLPDLEVDDFTISNTKIVLDPVDSNYINLGLQGADNSLLISATNIAGKITGSFKYQWFLLYAHGDFEADIEAGGAGYEI